jgi:hypothetical protein
MEAKNKTFSEKTIVINSKDATGSNTYDNPANFVIGDRVTIPDNSILTIDIINFSLINEFYNIDASLKNNTLKFYNLFLDFKTFEIYRIQCTLTIPSDFYTSYQLLQYLNTVLAKGVNILTESFPPNNTTNEIWEIDGYVTKTTPAWTSANNQPYIYLGFGNNIISIDTTYTDPLSDTTGEKYTPQFMSNANYGKTCLFPAERDNYCYFAAGFIYDDDTKTLMDQMGLFSEVETNLRSSDYYSLIQSYTNQFSHTIYDQTADIIGFHFFFDLPQNYSVNTNNSTVYITNVAISTGNTITSTPYHHILTGISWLFVALDNLPLDNIITSSSNNYNVMACIPLNVNFGQMVQYNQQPDDSKTLTSANNIDTLVIRFLDQKENLVDMTYITWTITLRLKTFMTMEEYQKVTSDLTQATVQPIFQTLGKESATNRSQILNVNPRKRGFFGETNVNQIN